MAADADRVLALVEALLQADSLEPAVRDAARHVGDATEAVTSGIIIMIHGGVFLESWHPEMPTRSRALFQPVRSLALQTAQHGTSGYMPLDTAGGAPLMAQAIPLTLGHRLQAALCVVSFPEVDQKSASTRPPLDRLGRIIALRLDELAEIEAARRKSQQFERWFHVSDRQIRALDLERQKFAALVSSFTGGAFTTNRDGIISWQSRPLFDKSGAADDTWVGHSCRELCGALRGSGPPACGECLIERVLISRQAASCEIPLAGSGPAGEERVTRAVAAPINDLAGHAQEVIVTFQEATQRIRKAA